MRLLNHSNDLDNRRLMRRQLRAHLVNRVLQRNNHPRADQLNPAHQAFLANRHRVLLVNRRGFLVNHRLVSRELRRVQPLQVRA